VVAYSLSKHEAALLTNSIGAGVMLITAEVGR
jgi:hypothetical protein